MSWRAHLAPSLSTGTLCQRPFAPASEEAHEAGSLPPRAPAACHLLLVRLAPTGGTGLQPGLDSQSVCLGAGAQPLLLNQHCCARSQAGARASGLLPGDWWPPALLFVMTTFLGQVAVCKNTSARPPPRPSPLDRWAQEAPRGHVTFVVTHSSFLCSSPGGAVVWRGHGPRDAGRKCCPCATEPCPASAPDEPCSVCLLETHRGLRAAGKHIAASHLARGRMEAASQLSYLFPWQSRSGKLIKLITQTSEHQE